MAFSENEGRQVRTFRVSFREMTRIFAALGGFNLSWHWLTTVKISFLSPLHKTKNRPSWSVFCFGDDGLAFRAKDLNGAFALFIRLLFSLSFRQAVFPFASP